MEESFNSHLGKKLRMRRLSLGLTQTKVAQAINVTFQQIQKYETSNKKQDTEARSMKHETYRNMIQRNKRKKR